MEKLYDGRFYEEQTVNGDETLNVTIAENGSGALLFFLEPDCSYFHLTLDAKPYSYFKIFIQNKSTHEIDLILDASMHTDSKCELGILDLDPHSGKLKAHMDLLEQGATFEIYTGQLAQRDTRKVSDMEIVHHAPHTYGNMHNFAVQFADSYYEMVANGNIKKGCTGAQSHQETRVLTLEHNALNKVIPLLLIDENDVKASHALSIGQPDAQQMYYLQSRGLTPAQAMGLLSIGYFMPVLSLVDNDEKRQELIDQMERQVGLHGHREAY